MLSAAVDGVLSSLLARSCSVKPAQMGDGACDDGLVLAPVFSSGMVFRT